jgi:hypothetical protein
MARLRFPGIDERNGRDPEPLPFPGLTPATPPRRAPVNPMGFVGPQGSSMPDVLDAFDKVSRRMEDLAQNLGCFGFFDGDDGDDRPTAA